MALDADLERYISRFLENLQSYLRLLQFYRHCLCVENFARMLSDVADSELEAGSGKSVLFSHSTVSGPHFRRRLRHLVKCGYA